MLKPAPQRPPHTPLVPPGGIDAHARDMTATVSADVTLEGVQQRLGELEQWLPIDGDLTHTIGQLVERNSTGPLRLGYGAWRDLLLGAQFTNGRGELITAGGRTVKNVAGYDLTKFMVGQNGVFGRLVTVTTRTYRKPAGSLVARFNPDVRLLLTLIPRPKRPQWAVLTVNALWLGYLGDQPTLDYYQRVVAELQPREIITRKLSDDVAFRAGAWRAVGETTFRASVPPIKLVEFGK